ncbi:hypothetical protein GCM10027445_50430 [Amycolatopsis endophytica]|uniref:Peptidase M41 domain-containing protein n=1 Tax=Amycolatopsis endophytica TaxID=860233 RepID=A0A853AZ65_9PSEU|nr:hypothetical protein [Amycolatopsis endophytica]NYI87884.1 hypothetical protein [Amycolatopsis endophytica]
MGRPRYDTDDALSLGALAAHEAGHGVIAVVQGVQVLHCHLGATTGYTRHRNVDADHPEIALAILLAGQEAEAYWLTRYAGYWFGSALRTAADAAEHDLREIRRLRKRHGLSENRLRSHTRSLVRRHWNRIDRAGHRLYSRGRLSGSAL